MVGNPYIDITFPKITDTLRCPKKSFSTATINLSIVKQLLLDKAQQATCLCIQKWIREPRLTIKCCLPKTIVIGTHLSVSSRIDTVIISYFNTKYLHKNQGQTHRQPSNFFILLSVFAVVIAQPWKVR